MMISNTDRINFSSDYELDEEFQNLIRQFRLESKSNDTRNENPSSETTKDFAAEIEVQATLGNELTSSQGIEISAEEGNTLIYAKTSSTHLELGSSSSGPIVTFEQKSSSQELMNEQSTIPLEETDATVKSSQLEGSTSEKTEAATMSTISETKTEPPTQFVAPNQKGIKINVEDGTTSNNVTTLTSSAHSKSISLSSGPLATFECETSSLIYGDGQITIASPPIAITKPLSLTTQDVDVGNSQKSSNTNDDQVSLNDDIVIKVTSIIPSPQAFQTPSMMSKGDLSQKDEELEDGNDQKAMTSFSVATIKTNDQVSRNDDAFKKVSSNIGEQFPKDDDLIVSKSPVVSQFTSVPSEGDTSQIVGDLNYSLLVTRELEQLVSKKHLDYESLSLLTDFLVKHPSVLLKDTSLSNRYKNYAYNCLVELLKFLQTHSVLDVLGSSHSEFVELLQDVRKFPFDKEWLDAVERRTLFPGLQVSQDALQKLLDSKHILTQHVEDLKHQLASSEAVLKTITQQEEQILETRASLSDPIGY